MKNNKPIQLFLTLMIGLLIFTSCISVFSSATTIVPSSSPPTPPLSTEITATFYVPTVVPTLLLEQERRLAEALQSADCILPCYLGIIPGKTTLRDARAILENFGGIYWGPYQRIQTDEAFLYTYQFQIGDPISGEKIIYADITLITDNNLVQILEASPSTGRLTQVGQISLETYQKYWSRYFTARQIFLQLGEPDQMYTISDSNELIISYNDPSAKITIFGTANENNLCPKDRLTSYLSVDMIISNYSSPFSIDGDGGVPLTDHDVYSPIEEGFGISTHDFYEQVMQDPSVCFEPITTTP